MRLCEDIHYGSLEDELSPPGTAYVSDEGTLHSGCEELVLRYSTREAIKQLLGHMAL